MARYAINLPVFNDIVRTKTARIERSTDSQDVTLRNTARFLWRFDGADGIKTGYTKEAGRCFVGSATRDDWKLIAVVLKSNDAGADTEVLLDYGFKHFKQITFARSDRKVTSVPVRGGVAEQIDLVANDDLTLVLSARDNAETSVDIDIKMATAPFDKGDKLGTLTGYLNGEEVGSVDLLATESVDRTLLATMWVVARGTFLVVLVGLMGFVTYGTAAAKAARRRRLGISARG